MANQLDCSVKSNSVEAQRKAENLPFYLSLKSAEVCKASNTSFKSAINYIALHSFPMVEGVLSRIYVGEWECFDSKFLSKSSQAVVQDWLRGREEELYLSAVEVRQLIPVRLEKHSSKW